MPFSKANKLIKIEKFIEEQENLYPEASGEFTELMKDFTNAIKKISHQVRRAGLNDVLGLTPNRNIHGENIKKVDEYANSIIESTMKRSGNLCCMISEENDDIIKIPKGYTKGNYILAFDPIDGSSNIDVNITIGTIFSLYKRKNLNSKADASDNEILQSGKNQVAAGYTLYGSSTILVFTTGSGVNVFSLDPDSGEFFLIFENIIIPETGSMYSCNEGNYYKWKEWTKRYIKHLKTPSDDGLRPYNFRYVASSVADIHRTLYNGGIYLYPSCSEYPSGKIRLLYEANPLSMIVEQAGGLASTGEERILDIVPNSIHQTVPFFIGSKNDVLELEKFCKG